MSPARRSRSPQTAEHLSTLEREGGGGLVGQCGQRQRAKKRERERERWPVCTVTDLKAPS